MLNKRYNSLLFLILYGSIAFANANQTAGLYLGGNLGYGETALARPPLATSFRRSGVTWSILSGLQFCKNLAFEAGFNRMRNVLAAVPSSNATATVEPSFTYFAFKASFPIKNNVSLYGRAGGAYSYGKESETINGKNIINSTGKVVPYVSAGFEYELTSKLYLDASVSNTFKAEGIPRLTTGAVGLRYLILDFGK